MDSAKTGVGYGLGDVATSLDALRTRALRAMVSGASALYDSTKESVRRGAARGFKSSQVWYLNRGERVVGIKENKEIVRRYCDALSAGDIKACLNLTTDDFIVWVPGSKERIPVCGRHQKSEVAAMYAAWPTMFPKGFKVTINAMTAEGDRVAVEAQSYGETAAGKLYEQTYHYLFIIRNDKIAVQHEYLDTLHLKERMVDDFAGILTAR